MLVYGDHKECMETSLMIGRIREIVRFLAVRPDYDHAVELLSECGSLETAVTDQLCTDAERVTVLTSGCRQLTLSAAWILNRCYRSESVERSSLQSIMKQLEIVGTVGWPREIEYSVPEGYAFYALYPECYICSAEKFYNQVHPSRVVCIGLRSIGSSLSAVVASRLQQLGVEAVSFTVRPRGHPFDRYVEFGGELVDFVRSGLSGLFLIVDEGPGLSGSSLCGTARSLEAIGVSAHNVVLFPSWVPSGRELLSEQAKICWPVYRKVCTAFEDVKSRMRRFSSLGECLEVSAGRWREVLWGPHSEYPAVNPFHERRKFLVRGEESNRYRSVLKFAGLGKEARESETLSRSLEERNFAPAVIDCSEGFIQYEFIDGSRHQGNPGNEFLSTVADYFACRREVLPVDRKPVPLEQMELMIRVNTEESIGRRFAEGISSNSLIREELYYEDTAAVDGRMFPHKWVNSSGNWYKLDGTDHHRDQFLPGVQNSAWDVAGFFIEFGLSRAQRKIFLEMYGKRMADPFIIERLPFYLVAYSAFRTGYAVMAAESLGESSDGIRFRRLAKFYKYILRTELVNAGIAPVSLNSQNLQS